MTDRTHRVDGYISPLALFVGLGCCVAISTLPAHTTTETLWYFTATLLAGVSFVLVSRFRNRSSFVWFALASVASNATWFLERSALSTAEAPVVFILLAVCATLAGRTYAVRIAERIEHRYKLVANLDSGEKKHHLQRFIADAIPGWNLLGGILLLYIFVIGLVSQSMGRAAFIVVVLGFFQNVIYTQKSRLSQRGKNNPRTVIPSALLGVLSGLWFYVSFAYLAKHHMALYLWVPYVVTTVSGSTVGMWLSMKWELAMGIGGNDHLPGGKSSTPLDVAYVARKERVVYSVLLVAGLLWIVIQEILSSFVGMQLTPLSFPWWEHDGMPRALTLAAMTVTLFAAELTHTLIQSSGNRNHVRYHAVTIVLWASTGFLVARTVLENPTWDIVPLAIIGNTLGFLFGRALSGKIEKFLVARMD